MIVTNKKEKVNIYKKAMQLSIAIAMAFSFTAKPVRINSVNVNSVRYLGAIELHHNNKQFFVKQDNEIHRVQNCFIDNEISDITTVQLQYVLGNIKEIEIDGKRAVLVRSDVKLTQVALQKTDVIKKCALSQEAVRELSQSSYIEITRKSDGEFNLELKHRMLGGGIWGAVAGAWIGKFVASAVCHTGIFIVSAAVSVVATPAAGIILGASLESTFGASIEAFTTAAALAAGITGAVVTGPI